jgi:hypothetical protein
MVKPVIAVSFTISPEVETEFNRFYHRSFLPNLVEHSPEIERLVRYEEFAVGGSLRWYNRQFITIYQLDSEDAISNVDRIFSRPEVIDDVRAFGDWKQKHLQNFARVTYSHRWHHRRGSEHQAFTGPAFVWQHETSEALEDDFQDWYEQKYLPQQVAEIPTWSGARRYHSVGRPTTRYLTWFETDSESNLATSMKDLRSPHRLADNMEWQQRVQAAIVWQDVASFRPIYRWPD